MEETKIIYKQDVLTNALDNLLVVEPACLKTGRHLKPELTNQIAESLDA